MKYCISKCGMQVCLHCGLPEKLEQTYSVLKCNCIEDVKSLTVGILLVVPNKTPHYTCQKTNRKKKKVSQNCSICCSIAVNSHTNHLQRCQNTKNFPQFQMVVLLSVRVLGNALFHYLRLPKETFPAENLPFPAVFYCPLWRKIPNKLEYIF